VLKADDIVAWGFKFHSYGIAFDGNVERSVPMFMGAKFAMFGCAWNW
jgi:hypothetical protein